MNEKLHDEEEMRKRGKNGDESWSIYGSETYSPGMDSGGGKSSGEPQKSGTKVNEERQEIGYQRAEGARMRNQEWSRGRSRSQDSRSPDIQTLPAINMEKMRSASEGRKRQLEGTNNIKGMNSGKRSNSRDPRGEKDMNRVVQKGAKDQTNQSQKNRFIDSQGTLPRSESREDGHT